MCCLSVCLKRLRAEWCDVSPCPCPGRLVLEEIVKVLAVQFFQQNFALTPLWIHQQNYVLVLVLGTQVLVNITG